MLWCPVGFVSPASFEAVPCSVCGRRRVAMYLTLDDLSCYFKNHLLGIINSPNSSQRVFISKRNTPMQKKVYWIRCHFTDNRLFWLTQSTCSLKWSFSSKLAIPWVLFAPKIVILLLGWLLGRIISSFTSDKRKESVYVAVHRSFQIPYCLEVPGNPRDVMCLV